MKKEQRKQGLYQSLNKMIEQGITIKHISEELEFVSHDSDAFKVKKDLEEMDYDTTVVENEGKVIGYVNREELGEGECEIYIHEFEIKDIVSESTPLLDALYLFEEKSRIFILEKNNITRIINLADLQKPPVRMLIFGLITLLESYITEMIVDYYPDEKWKDSIPDERLSKAESVYNEKLERNEALRLVDCLLIADKFNIVKKNKELRVKLELSSRKEASSFFHKIEELRNILAHAHDLGVEVSWDDTIKSIKNTEGKLRNCEEFGV